MTKNAFYLMLKSLSGYVEKRLDKKPRVIFKIYDVRNWTINNYKYIYCRISQEVKATTLRNLVS